MTDVLAEIVERKRADVAIWRHDRSLDSLDAESRSNEAPRGFVTSLRAAVARGESGLIAEIKKASPSHGMIRPNFDPAAIAMAYAEGGATCLSVLTDGPYFQGDNSHLAAARAAVPLPILRKDFMIDPWQVAEARALGADCILLIMAAIGDGLAAELADAARERRLDMLIEVHNLAEMERALRLDSALVGINNRDLKTLTTSLETSIELAHRIPRDRLGVSESGIASHADVTRLAGAGLRCLLVGEALLRHDDVASATRALLGRAA
jgi:indole-3-glycerol phosphate synthase